MKATWTAINPPAPPIRKSRDQEEREAPIARAAFEAQIEREFVAGSAIAPDLYRSAIAFHSDIETGDGGEVTTPIHETLGWHFTRFGYQARDPFHAAFFVNADSSTWQAKVSNPPPGEKGYYAPKGNGSRVFLPEWDVLTWLKVCLRHNIDFPQELEQWLDSNLPNPTERTNCFTAILFSIGINPTDVPLCSLSQNVENRSNGSFQNLSKNTQNGELCSDELKGSAFTPLSEGHQPLEIDPWQWVENHPEIPRYPTEGGKKALALLSRGYVPIALYGATAGYRTSLLPAPELIEDVQRFCQPGATFVLTFDQDAKPKTIHKVAKALRTFGGLLKQAGCTVRVASWSSSQGKGIDDLIVNCGGDVADRILTAAAPLKDSRKQTQNKQDAIQQWLGALLSQLGIAAHWEREPDKGKAIRFAREVIARVALNQNRLPGQATVGFFPQLEMPATGDRILYALDGQKGTGKSQTAIKSIVDACNRSIKSVAIFAPTELLCKSLAAVLGVPSIYEDRKSPITVLCPESAHKLQGRTFEAVIVDEANECIQRFAQGNLGKEPERCRAQFERLIAGANVLVLAQDGLTQTTVETVSRLANISPAQAQTIKRQRWASDITIKLYADRSFGRVDEGQKARANDAKFTWLHQLLSDLEAGLRVVVPCGSQRAAREIARLIRARFGRGKRVRTFDGRDSFHQAKTEFCQNPDRWLAAHEIDVLIFTPCFNSGVSIESEYFDVQYEYATPFEAAESISQRGERVRDAIWGNRIQERHIYLSYRGLAACPDPIIFTAEYWDGLLHGDAIAPLNAAIPVADAIGANAILNRFKTKELKRLDDWRELPAMLAFESLQVYFKQEFLLLEWRGNGWDVEAMFPLPSEVLEPLRDLWQLAKEDLIAQRSRIGAKCRNYEDLDPDCDEVNGPIHRQKVEKHRLASWLYRFEGIDQADWWEAWIEAPGDSGGINAARVNALLQCAIANPEHLEKLQTWRILRTIGSLVTVRALPPTHPSSDREIDLVSELMQIPLIREALEGLEGTIDKSDPLVLQAAQFAVERATTFARLTKHNNRIHGYQFTPKTPAMKAAGKLLKMAGMRLKHTGFNQGAHHYRIECEEDIRADIYKAAAKGKPLHRLKRKLYRAKTLGELTAHLKSRLGDAISALTPQWDAYTQKLLANLPENERSELQLGGQELSTEVLIASSVPSWLTLSALIRRAKDWVDFEKLGALFPLNLKQRIWDALGEADSLFRHQIWEMKPG